MPDGGIRDDQGRLLLDAAGQEPNPEAALPYPPQAWERKARTEALLAARGIEVPRHLPPLISEPELVLRSPEEIAGRAFALMAVATRAESLAARNAMASEQVLARLPAARAHLSPAEQAFLAEAAPPEAEVVRFSWRYEGVAVLLWVLGRLDAELPFPEAACDVAGQSRLLLEAGDVPGLLRLGSPRPPAAQLDALDLHYRLTWRLRESRQRGLPPPAGVDAGVVQERHHALNWLVRFEDAPWDEVDTPS